MPSHVPTRTEALRFRVALFFALSAALTALAAAQPWISVGPEGGFVQVMEGAATDPSLLLAAASGGMYRSTDTGATWELVTPGLDITPAAMAFDPSDASIVYAGVVRFNEESGVYKSFDSGVTWRQLGLFGTDVLSLAIDPSNPSTVFAGTYQEGIFRSTDGGETWSAKNEGLEVPDTSPTFSVSALAFDPVTPSTIYAGLDPFSVSKSTDWGETWTTVNASNLPVGGAGVNALAVDPEDPSTVYVVANNTGLYRSRDAGATWRRVLRIQLAGVIHSVRIRHGAVYAAGRGLFRSFDHGQHWTHLTESLGDLFGISSLVVHPDDPSVILISDSQGRGVYRTDDGGLTWATSNRRLHGRRADVVVAQGDTVYLASFVTVFRSTDAGRTWTAAGGPEEPVMTLAIDPRDPETVWAGTLSGVHRSVDGGVTWSSRRGGLDAAIRAMAVDPAASAVVYAGAGERGASPGGVFKTTDGGESWDAIDDGITDLDVRALALADSSTVYVGTSDSGVFRSMDAGGSWTPLRNGLPESGVYGLVVDPGNPSTVYATTVGEVYKTMDGGETWSAVGPGLSLDSVGVLALDPEDPSTIYAATQRASVLGHPTGVYRSTDGGASWEFLAAGLLEREITSLAVAGGGVVLAGTHSNGVFRSQPCASPTSLCLDRQRFRVEVEWTDFAGKTGFGRTVPVTSDDSGLFWFFHPDNWEVLVKVLDGCRINGHFWVFAAATTNVGYTLRVVDTQSSRVREYVNPLGVSAAATTDVAAFATCP